MFSKSSKVFIKILLLSLLAPLNPSMVLSKSIFDENTNEVIANNNNIVTVEVKGKGLTIDKAIQKAAVNALKKVAGTFIDSKTLIKNRGKILNIGSIFSEIVPNFSNYKGTNMNSPAAYSVSKNSLLHLTKWQASYFAPYVNVNMISPGGISRNQNKKFIKKYINSTPLKRMCREEDVIFAILFLLSDMSNYITGQNLNIDGGYSIL